MLVMAIIFTWDGGQHVGDGHQFYLGWWSTSHHFYLGWWSTCQCWPSFLPGMVAMLVMAINFTWDGGQHAIIFTWDDGQHVSDGHQFTWDGGQHVGDGHQFSWDGGQHDGDGHQFYLGW